MTKYTAALETTQHVRAKLRASLYSLAHDIFGGLLLAGLIVALAFLYSDK